jgi:ferrous iron transport protein B
MVTAPLVALALKRTLLRGQTPVFVLEMPPYKRPSPRLVLRRMFDSGWAFVRRAGTLILASMVLVWALLYFPSAHPEGGTYPERIAQKEEPIKDRQEALRKLQEQVRQDRKELRGLEGREGAAPESEELRRRIDEAEAHLKPLHEAHALRAEWTRQSLLGRAGRALEPAVRPLGWDWRVGVAALASFPAREVVVGTLGIVFQVGKTDTEEIRDEENPADTELGQALQAAHWEGSPDRKLFTVPAVLSLLVFFALCCQCASTLAVIRRETRSWRWPLFTFTYMTVLAYVAALAVYQAARLLA